MNRARDDLLAGARLAVDEDRRRRPRELGDLGLQAAGRRRGRDEARENRVDRDVLFGGARTIDRRSLDDDREQPERRAMLRVEATADAEPATRAEVDELGVGAAIAVADADHLSPAEDVAKDRAE